MTIEGITGERLPAEWEHSGGVMLSWPHSGSDWSYMLEEIGECYSGISEALLRYGVTTLIIGPEEALEDARRRLAGADKRLLTFAEVSTNDTWVRDYGPLTLIDGGGNLCLADYGFNAWGLKFASDQDNRVCRRLKRSCFRGTKMHNRLGFILEGGSIESDGKGTLMSTAECLYNGNRNPGLSHEEIRQRLLSDLGGRQLLLTHHGGLSGDDTDSHIDTLARLAPNDTIIYIEGRDDDEQATGLRAMEEEIRSFRTLEGRPYRLLALPLPAAIHDREDGHILPATYANYLVTPQAVFCPTYGQEDTDRLSQEILGQAFPDRPIVGVDCRALIRQHGSLHCATMQLPPSIIEHP